MKLTLSRIIQSATSTLRGQTLALGLLALVLIAGNAWFITSELNRARDDMSTVSRDSVPSVDAAQVLSAQLAQLNTTAADYLSAAGLTDVRDCVLPGGTHTQEALTNHECSARAIPLLEKQIWDQVYLAVRNVTYPGERTLLGHVQLLLSAYEVDLGKMQENYELGAAPSATQYHYLHQSYQDLLAAEDVLTKPAPADSPLPSYEENVVLPNCVLPGTKHTLTPSVWTQESLQIQVRCLAGINLQHLNEAYNDGETSVGEGTSTSLWIVIGSLLFLLVVLIRAIVISRSVLHILPMVAMGLTLFGCWTGITTLQSFTGDAGSFHRAVIADRISIDAAYRIDDYSSAANGGESLYLVAANFNDSANIERWQQDWNLNIARVGSRDQQEGDAYVAFQNITYAEEGVAIQQMQDSWDQYLAQDRLIRDAVQSRDPNNSNGVLVAQRISTGPSDQAFQGFVSATQSLRNIDLGDYESTLKRMNGKLQSAAWLVPLSLLLALALSLAGTGSFARDLLGRRR